MENFIFCTVPDVFREYGSRTFSRNALKFNGLSFTKVYVDKISDDV